MPAPSPGSAQAEAETRSTLDRDQPPVKSVRELNSLQDDSEAVQLLREIRHDLAKLTKISEKASRRNRTYLEGTKFSRRFGIALLILIVVLMLIQILQMAGYGPGSESGNDSTQTLQRIHTAG